MLDCDQTESGIKARAEILAATCLANFERVLALLNRNPADPLCGSFDREYWAWNFKDYPNLSLQAGVHLLALMWASPLPSNPYHQDPQLLLALEKALLFWVRGQKANGSFDQCYYNEQSYGTTSYTLIAVLKALAITEGNLHSSCLAQVETAIERAVRFVMRHAETYGEIANHQAQFLYALLLIKKRFTPPGLEQRIQQTRDLLLALQSPEGWFREYDGLDVGYLSQTIYYLSMAHELSGDLELAQRAGRALEFFANFVHPDCGCGGAYGSRYNSAFYPAGFVNIGRRSPWALAVLNHVVSGQNRYLDLALMDPENLIRMMINYLEAMANWPQDDGPTVPLPWQRDSWQQEFPEAGLLVRVSSRLYSVISAKRGGCMVVFDKATGRQLLHDQGYLVSLASGRALSNGVRQDGRLSLEGDTVKLRAQLAPAGIPLYSPWKGFVLRALGLTLLRITALNDFFKKWLVKLLVTGQSPSQATLTRTVRFSDGVVTIHDELDVPADDPIVSLRLDPDMRTRKMGSTGYYCYPTPPQPTLERIQGSTALVERAVEAQGS